MRLEPLGKCLLFVKRVAEITILVVDNCYVDEMSALNVELLGENKAVDH